MSMVLIAITLGFPYLIAGMHDLECGQEGSYQLLTVDNLATLTTPDGDTYEFLLEPYYWDMHTAGMFRGPDISVYHENHYGLNKNVIAIIKLPSGHLIKLQWDTCNNIYDNMPVD